CPHLRGAVCVQAVPVITLIWGLLQAVPATALFLLFWERGPSTIALVKTSAPGGDAPLSKCAPESGELAPQATKGLSLSRLPAQPCQPGNLLRRVAFSAMRKPPKNRQRRGLPPPCGIHPAG